MAKRDEHTVDVDGDVDPASDDEALMTDEPDNGVRTSPRPPVAGEGSFLGAFPVAIQAVIDGQKITRREWGNPGIRVYLVNGRLTLRKADGTVHDLIVSDGDLFAIDWVLVREH